MKDKSEQGTVTDLGKPPSPTFGLVTLGKKKKKKDDQALLKSIKQLLGYVAVNPLKGG